MTNDERRPDCWVRREKVLSDPRHELLSVTEYEDVIYPAYVPPMMRFSWMFLVQVFWRKLLDVGENLEDELGPLEFRITDKNHFKDVVFRRGSPVDAVVYGIKIKVLPRVFVCNV